MANYTDTPWITPNVSTPPPPHPDSSLIKHESARPNALDDLNSQLLWLATQRRPWRTLAVVGGSEGVPTMEVANMLSRLAWWYRGQPSSVADFRDLSLRLVEYQLGDLALQLERGAGSVMIALRSMTENPTVVPVARAVDAVILCVQLGATDIKSSRKTVEAIGRDRFLGTIVIDKDGKPKK
jgi:hypothetical protein